MKKYTGNWQDYKICTVILCRWPEKVNIHNISRYREYTCTATWVKWTKIVKNRDILKKNTGNCRNWHIYELFLCFIIQMTLKL